IRARRPSLGLRVRKWGRRHRALVGAAAAAAAIAVVALAVSTVLIAGAWQAETAALQGEREQRREADGQKRLAQGAQAGEAKQRRTAEQERDRAEHRLYVSDMVHAQHAWELGSLQLVQEHLAAHLREPSGRDLRGWEWYYLNGLCHQARHTFHGLKGQTLSL